MEIYLGRPEIRLLCMEIYLRSLEMNLRGSEIYLPRSEIYPEYLEMNLQRPQNSSPSMTYLCFGADQNRRVKVGRVRPSLPPPGSGLPLLSSAANTHA